MTRHIPDIVLERYRLNELPEASARTVEYMLAADPSLRERLQALERSDEDIRQRYAGLTVHDVPARSRRAVLTFALAGAAVVVALVIAVALPRTPAPAPAPDVDRIKGGRPVLAVYRRTASGSERLADGDIVHAGDLLRVGYASAGRAYGLILSIDGRKAVTLHLPASGDRAVALTAGRTVLLDAAYELDDAPRIERFYFVTGTQPFAAEPILQAARRAAGAATDAPAALPLPAGLEQVTFAIQKEERK